MIDPMNVYRFDLNGYFILRGALTEAEVLDLNRGIDAIPEMDPGEWYGYVHSHSFDKKNGVNLQQIYEAGPAFEKLIDHPAWHDYMLKFAGGQDSFDQAHGPMFIDEAFASLRGVGESIGMHSGGDCWSKRNQYRFRNGHFMAMQVNVLIALTDIGPGDGGTTIIPASHKQNIKHPLMSEFAMSGDQKSGDGMPEAIEVFMKAGDALIFTDTICHGSAKRTRVEGQRRIIVYRYGPSWGMFRHGYRPSPELLDRLTPQQRKIVWPHEVLSRTPNRLQLPVESPIL